MDVLELLDELEEWTQALAIRYRAEGYSAQMRGESIIAATCIGREFAMLLVVSEVRDIRTHYRPKGDALAPITELLTPGTLDPRD